MLLSRFPFGISADLSSAPVSQVRMDCFQLSIRHSLTSFRCASTAHEQFREGMTERINQAIPYIQRGTAPARLSRRTVNLPLLS
jgi:hypothetical protein